MKIRHRIWLLPAIAIIASVVSIGANYRLSSSVSQLLSDAGASDYPQLNAANTMQAAVAALEETLKYAVSAGDKNALTNLEGDAAGFRAATAELSKVPSRKATADKLNGLFARYLGEARESASIMIGLKTGDLTAHVTAMQAAQEQLHTALSQFQSAASERFTSDLDSGRSAVRKQLIVALAGGALIVIGLAISAQLLIPSIMRPINQAVAVAQSVAKGDIGVVIDSAGNDEMALLLRAMQEMVQSFTRFAAAQAQLAREHAAGNTHHVIPAQDFPGIYGHMAASINELARSHIAVTDQVIGVVTRYAVGDLSADMAELPGKQADVTAAVKGVKLSLQSVSREISRLAEAAARGDLRARGDTDRYQHDFRQMVSELNKLMEVSDAGLHQVARVLGALARGDLTETISTDYQGAFGQLTDDANATVVKISQIVAQLHEAADAIQAVSGMSGEEQGRSLGIERASTMEATAASLARLTEIVKHNAAGAAQATTLAAQMRDVAEIGGQVVGEAVAAVHEINDSSRKIVDIIDVIDEIAFQTNLLALNAAVEAARAGEHGRGFAVVAAEVRSLAGRSKEAANEVKKLIEDSVRKVESGCELVNRSGEKLQEIVSSVSKVTRIVGEIAAASREQATSIEGVSRSVSAMDALMQRNADNLMQAVSVFKVQRSPSDARGRAERAA